MATHDIPILGPMTAPDSSGKCFFQPLEIAETIGTGAYGTLLVLTMQAPAAAGDLGFYGKFNVPQNYVDTPILVIRGVLGEAGQNLGFGIDTLARAHSETVDAAFEVSDVVANGTWTGLAAEEMYEETIALTTTLAVGDEVFYYLYRDDSGDDQAGAFHLTGAFFRYNDA